MAVCAAVCKLVAICDVTWLYSVGLDCCNCCSVLSTWAKGESWALLSCGIVSEDGSMLLLLEVPVEEVPVAPDMAWLMSDWM